MRRQFIKKLIFASVLIVLSAALTVLIKEALDTQNPENALPIITITHNGAPVSEQHIHRAGYEWSFFTTTERKLAPALIPEDLPIVPLDAIIGSNFEITFSSTPTSIALWRATGQYSTDFSVLETEKEGVFSTPVESGVYLYRINASWGQRGEIQYYFAVNVV